MTKQDRKWYNENKLMADRNFLIVKDVAKKLSVSERSVMRYIKAKKLRASKIGQWRITPEDLARFVNSHANLRT